MKFSRTSHAGARRRARVAALLTALGCTVLVALAPGCSSGGSGAGTTGGKAARGHGGKGRHGKAGKGKGFLGRSPAGPPPAAPPAAAPKPAPALPELPELAAQAKTDAPAKAPAAESKCGDAAMGEVTVPLDCLDGDDKLPHPLKPLVPYATLHADEAALPAVVDHHAAGAEGPVADQGKAPLSSAFAVAGAVEHALAVWSGAPAKVSVMQLWSRYHAPSLAKALAAAADTGLAPDDAWPFSRADAVSWLESCDKWAGPVKCGKPVDAEK
ncbi:MAG TPA: hypothetical protein VHB21_02895, partial [Minicystis sp.]|nr:hypothetical protein [Minicystis sp.]